MIAVELVITAPVIHAVCHAEDDLMAASHLPEDLQAGLDALAAEIFEGSVIAKIERVGRLAHGDPMAEELDPVFFIGAGGEPAAGHEGDDKKAPPPPAGRVSKLNTHFLDPSIDQLVPMISSG